MLPVCPGNGSCFDPNATIFTKNPKNNQVICEHMCQIQLCPNYQLCHHSAPKWVFDAHDGRCWTCNFTFAINLAFNHEKMECPICLNQTETSVAFPGCQVNHFICTRCFWNHHITGYEDNGYPYKDTTDNNDENEQYTSDEDTNDEEYVHPNRNRQDKRMICRSYWDAQNQWYKNTLQSD